MTTVAIHQPQYLPWVPYCDKADSCDIFVYLDTVQFQKNGVQNRNQIKTEKGAQWLTVPVRASLSQTIREIRIADDRWQKKHILSIQQNYGRAPFLDLFDQGLRPIFQQPWELLVDLNIAVTEWLFQCLAISCKRIRASELNVVGSKDDLVVDICRAVGATVYFSGQGAKSYQDEEKFRHHNIEVCYQLYRNQPYQQCHPEIGFVPDLSGLDLILNMGPEARTIMVAGKMAPLKAHKLQVAKVSEISNGSSGEVHS